MSEEKKSFLVTVKLVYDQPLLVLAPGGSTREEILDLVINGKDGMYMGPVEFSNELEPRYWEVENLFKCWRCKEYIFPEDQDNALEGKYNEEEEDRYFCENCAKELLGGERKSPRWKKDNE